MPKIVTNRPEAVIKQLRRLENKVMRKVIRQSLRANGKEMVVAIKAIAPRKTGKYRKSFKLRAIKRRRNRIGVYIRTGTRAELGISENPTKGYYPAALEFGSVKMPARPHIRPVFDSKAPGVIQRLSRDISRALNNEYGV